MQKYPTIYSDKTGMVETTINNSFSENGTNCLEILIDGTLFRGSSFDYFELIKAKNYKEEQLKRFTFNKVPSIHPDQYSWQLCNCSLETLIPQKIVDTEKETELQAILRMNLKLGIPTKKGNLNKMMANFRLKFGNEQFTCEFDDFESALKQFQQEILPRYRFKNCFSCHYSDYSPVGNGFFGSMMCFRNNKVDYLTAASKEDFYNLAGKGFIAVQETYLCQEFEYREKDTGYRGWPFD